MALDEYLYSKISKLIRGRRSAPKDESVVKLEDVLDRLTILAKAFTGADISVYTAQEEGGYKDQNFFLPEKVSLLNNEDANLSFYFYRVLYLSVQWELALNWKDKSEHSKEESRQQAIKTSKEVLTKMRKDYPLGFSLHENFVSQLSDEEDDKTHWIYGKWMNNTKSYGVKELKNFDNKTKEAEQKDLTTIKSKAVEEIISVQVDTKQQEDYVLTHNFEKVETAEEFSGVWRDFDGDDDLKGHQDALDELNLKHTVRVDDQAHSVYQADFIENTTVSESASVDHKGYHITYDEWNYSKRAYKEDFCAVYPLTQLKSNSKYYHRTIKDNASTLNGLRKMLANLDNKLQQQRRQRQGDEFDIEAVTDMLVDLHIQHTPSDKIYLSKRKKEKDISILLLLDISLSADSYANGNRIIDVEKQVSILFGEILNEFEIDFSIHCFFSKTRNYSQFITVKSFDEKWDVSKHRIGAIEPQGFTRIGAALRHAGALLEKRKTQNKWVIILSDGKPNDYDRYEGKYGVNDVKQALRELKEKRINSYALAIEAQAKYYLPKMFGKNHYQILTNPTEMLRSMVTLYEKIKSA
jgi:nitric oxide reductase NorD protein